MAKVRFFVNSNANAESTKDLGLYDTVKDLNLKDGEWEALSDKDKYKIAEEIANEHIEIWWKEE